MIVCSDELVAHLEHKEQPREWLKAELEGAKGCPFRMAKSKRFHGLPSQAGSYIIGA